MTTFLEDLVASPIGARLLHRLEWEQHPPVPWQAPILPNEKRIAEAADHVSAMSFAELIEAAFTASIDLGSWTLDAPTNAIEAYTDVELRRPIAEQIDAHFRDKLIKPIDVDTQEWWIGDAASPRRKMAPAFEELEQTYGSGEFPWGALRTSSTVPSLVHDTYVWEQEIPQPVGRWSLPVDPEAIAKLPIFHVHKPSDWAELVAQYPTTATPAQGTWNLPDNQSRIPSEHPLFSLPHQRAAVRKHAEHLVPDWTSVASQYSGVHLSWDGWITSEGCVHLDDQNRVSMVRYWLSDRTFWFRDVFGEPTPLPRPNIGQHSPPDQEQHERTCLETMLGR